MVRKPREELEVGKRILGRYIVKQVKRQDIVEPSEDLYEEINQHLYFRACNQVNEACNKIWTTCELYHQLYEQPRSAWLGEDFHRGFLPSSTIPVLYYADISSMVSLLHFFGIGSYRVKEKRGIVNYDLVRTANGFRLVNRKEHVRSLTGKTAGGWHDEVTNLYEGLLSNGIKLPRIGMDNFRALKQDRMDLDYGLLSQTTMAGAFGEKRFFGHLPHVIFVTRKALFNLQKIGKPLPNNCDVRFKNLISTIPSLGSRYAGRFSPIPRKLRGHVKRALESLE